VALFEQKRGLASRRSRRSRRGLALLRNNDTNHDANYCDACNDAADDSAGDSANAASASETRCGRSRSLCEGDRRQGQ